MRRLCESTGERLNTPYPYVIVFATFLLFLEAVASCFFSMEPRRETDLEDLYIDGRYVGQVYERNLDVLSRKAHRENEISRKSKIHVLRSIIHSYISPASNFQYISRLI